MIHRVFSSLGSFKNLEFGPGLNLLLADKTETSTDRQTRNRAGKSSLVELIHFVLGSNCDKDSIFRNPAIVNESFGMIFDLGGQRVTATRSGKKPSEVAVVAADTSSWIHQPNASGVIPNVKWREVLGALMFELRFEEGGEAWSPQFRQLIAYFVRRQSKGGFGSPFRQSTMQQTGDAQVALSFLLGLDWTVSRQWQIVRDRERMLREIRKASTTTELGKIVGDPAELRTRLAIAQDRFGRMRESVAAFRVVREYRELEEEATQITRRIGELSDENTLDRALAAELSMAMEQERVPSYADLDALYREAGVALPGVALRRFEEVTEFHASVVENRRQYLGGEQDEAMRRIESREREKEHRDVRLAEIMSILKAGGALDHYAALQSELTRMEADIESLRSQIDTAENLQGQQAELGIERQRLLLRLNQDMREQKARVTEAILTFEDVSSRLYEEAGILVIEASQDGPKFEVRIQGQGSKGVSAMQIFCFDIALIRLCAERGFGPGFLVHDSHIFDGVDERQVLTGLEVSESMAKAFGFQHIVTMNSDALPKMTTERGFKLEPFINPLLLTDASDDGGLFGIRFG